MSKWICIVIMSAVLFIGCEAGDEVIRDVNEVATGVRAVLESPAGQMIPPDWKLYGAVAVALANGIVIGWEELRNRTMKKTTKAIVKGIENTGNPEKSTSEVKSNIAEEMIKQGGERFYAKANKIVDNLKIS